MTARQQALEKIYRLYGEWTGEFTFACAKGCATCCTQSVTMTTLEGELLYSHILAQRPELLARLEEIPLSTSAPAMTTNQFAAACLKGEEADEDRAFWNLAPCIFLEGSVCTVYAARPFMCRSFASAVRCDSSGAAEIDRLFLSMNTVVMQCIEHLDQGRPWGNMNTILALIVDSRGDTPDTCHRHLFAEPIPGFLLLPEELKVLQDHIRILLGIIRSAAKTEKKLQ
jgi:Fe-S-cluster containining protein